MSLAVSVSVRSYVLVTDLIVMTEMAFFKNFSLEIWLQLEGWPFNINSI
jgi:hypothetical protein